MFGAWQPLIQSVIQQQVQPIPTLLRQLHATHIQQSTIQPSLCLILVYDTPDTTITMLWLSLHPILPLILQSHNMIQQATKPLSSYRYNKLVRPYTTIDTKYSDTTPLWIQQSITLPHSYWHSKLIYPKLPLILQAIMLPYYWYLIQQSSLLLYNHWHIVLWYFDTQLNHHYTTIDTAT